MIDYLIIKLPVPIKRATISLIKVKSCNALLRMLLVGIRSNLVCEDQWLFFEAKRGP
jgi:hypothetical protein